MTTDSLQGSEMDSRTWYSEGPCSLSQLTNYDDDDDSFNEPIYFIPLESPVPEKLRLSPYPTFTDVHYGESEYGSGSNEHFATNPHRYSPNPENISACSINSSVEQRSQPSFSPHQLPCNHVHSPLPQSSCSHLKHTYPCVQPFASSVQHANYHKKNEVLPSNIQATGNTGLCGSFVTAPADNSISQCNLPMHAIYPSRVNGSWSSVGTVDQSVDAANQSSPSHTVGMVAPTLTAPLQSLEPQQKSCNPMPRPRTCQQQHQSPLVIDTTPTGGMVQIPYTTYLESQIHNLRQHQLLILQQIEILRMRSKALSSASTISITSQNSVAGCSQSPLPHSPKHASVAPVSDHLSQVKLKRARMSQKYLHRSVSEPEFVMPCTDFKAIVANVELTDNAGEREVPHDSKVVVSDKVDFRNEVPSHKRWDLVRDNSNDGNDDSGDDVININDDENNNNEGTDEENARDNDDDNDVNEEDDDDDDDENKNNDDDNDVNNTKSDDKNSASQLEQFIQQKHQFKDVRAQAVNDDTFSSGVLCLSDLPAMKEKTNLLQRDSLTCAFSLTSTSTAAATAAAAAKAHQKYTILEPFFAKPDIGRQFSNTILSLIATAKVAEQANTAKRRRLSTMQASSNPANYICFETVPAFTSLFETVQKGQIIPSDRDVLCGKGGRTLVHNRHFTELCTQYCDEYTSTRKRGVNGKQGIALKIIQAVRDQNGRFLAPNIENDEVAAMAGKDGWIEISEAKAIVKVAHCMRDIHRKNRSPA